MDYVIADRKRAYNAHISLIGHLTKGDKVILNEKEVTACDLLAGDLTERASQLDGEVYTYIEAMTEINKGGWE